MGKYKSYKPSNDDNIMIDRSTTLASSYKTINNGLRVSNAYAYYKLGNLVLTKQGETAMFFINLTIGQNGRIDQNAYIIATANKGYKESTSDKQTSFVGTLYPQSSTLTTNNVEFIVYNSSDHTVNEIWLKYGFSSGVQYHSAQAFCLTSGTWEPSNYRTETAPSPPSGYTKQSGVTIIGGVTAVGIIQGNQSQEISAGGWKTLNISSIDSTMSNYFSNNSTYITCLVPGTYHFDFFIRFNDSNFTSEFNIGLKIVASNDATKGIELFTDCTKYRNGLLYSWTYVLSANETVNFKVLCENQTGKFGEAPHIKITRIS